MSIDNRNYSQIDQSQLREFKEALQQSGYQEADFDVRSMDQNQQRQQGQQGQHQAGQNQQGQQHQQGQQQGSSSFSRREQSGDQFTSRMEIDQQSQGQTHRICVKCQKTGKEKTYQGSNWVRDFKDDLKNNQFK